MEIVSPNTIREIANAHRSKMLFSHVIFSRRRPDKKSGWKVIDNVNYAANVLSELQKGRSVCYQPPNLYFDYEVGFSLHCTGIQLIGDYMFTLNDETAQGVIVFNQKFYDKICSRNSDVEDSELEEIVKKLNEIVYKTDDKTPYSLERKREQINAYLEGKINRINGSLVPNLTKGLDAQGLRKTIFYPLASIFYLRRGKPERKVDTYHIVGGTDCGVRAVKLTPKRSIVPLPIRKEDIAYYSLLEHKGLGEQ